MTLKWLAIATALALVGTSASAETLIRQKRIGNNTEGITYVAPIGTTADHAVAIDGNDVLSIPFSGKGGATKIFDVLRLDAGARMAKGIAWSPLTRLYYFSSLNATQIFASDAAGNPQPSLNLTGADFSNWSNWEGMTWVPASSPVFPSTIAALGIHTTDFVAHIFYINPTTGVVQGEVVPQPGTPVETYLCGIQYWPAHPGTFLISDCGVTGVWAIDGGNGSINQADPNNPLITLPEAGDIESIVVRSTGQIYLNGYDTGHLYAFDAGLNRKPALDRDLTVGLGVTVGRMTWNYDTGELIIADRLNNGKVWAVPLTLKSSRLLFNLASTNGEVPAQSALSYMGAGRLAIGNRLIERGIDIANVNTGASISRLTFNAGEENPDPFPGGSAFQVLGAGIDGTSTFLVRASGDANNLKVVSTTGTPDASSGYADSVRPIRLVDIPLSSPTTGIDCQLFDAGQGPHIFTGTEIYSTTGQLTHTVDAAALGITTTITGGTYASGADQYVVLDGDTSTLSVFKIP